MCATPMHIFRHVCNKSEKHNTIKSAKLNVYTYIHENQVYPDNNTITTPRLCYVRMLLAKQRDIAKIPCILNVHIQ